MKKNNGMGRNIPGGNFLGGNLPGGNFPGGSLMGGNFPGGNFPRTIFRSLQKVNIVIDMVARKTCHNTGTFRTHSNIYDGAFLLVKGFQPSTTLAKKVHCRCSTGL